MKQTKTYEAPLADIIVLHMEQRILDLSNGQGRATVENARAVDGEWDD